MVAGNPFYAFLGILFQTFLYTGLFITAHDAIHQSVLPGKPKVNKRFGTLILRAYALFDYNKVTSKHWDHHRFPASSKDPDFHDGTHKKFWPWYFHFLKNYLSIFQLIGMALIFNVLHHLFKFPIVNLLLFWVLPSLLSTVQLFYFGTFLTHRESQQGYKDAHRARSNEYNVLLSFVTCYHFGYHWEHHDRPNVPWWGLPKAKRENRLDQRHV